MTNQDVPVGGSCNAPNNAVNITENKAEKPIWKIPSERASTSLFNLLVIITWKDNIAQEIKHNI